MSPQKRDEGQAPQRMQAWGVKPQDTADTPPVGPRAQTGGVRVPLMGKGLGKKFWARNMPFDMGAPPGGRRGLSDGGTTLCLLKAQGVGSGMPAPLSIDSHLVEELLSPGGLGRARGGNT